jgi:hypothetical protein
MYIIIPLVTFNQHLDVGFKMMQQTDLEVSTCYLLCTILIVLQELGARMFFSNKFVAKYGAEHGND